MLQPSSAHLLQAHYSLFDRPKISSFDVMTPYGYVIISFLINRYDVFIIFFGVTPPHYGVNFGDQF